MYHSPVRELTGIRNRLFKNVQLGLWPQTEKFYPVTGHIRLVLAGAQLPP